MSYVDGCLLAVPTDGKMAYLEFAKEAAALFKRHGALKVVECWGDDVPEGELTSMSMAVKCGSDETVVFSWIYWPSKTARDAGWKAVMGDPAMDPEGKNMPFDGKRMIFGGFDILLET